MRALLVFLLLLLGVGTYSVAVEYMELKPSYTAEAVITVSEATPTNSPFIEYGLIRTIWGESPYSNLIVNREFPDYFFAYGLRN